MSRNGVGHKREPIVAGVKVPLNEQEDKSCPSQSATQATQWLFVKDDRPHSSGNPAAARRTPTLTIDRPDGLPRED